MKIHFYEQKAFTRIELLVVSSICTVLIALIILPKLAHVKCRCQEINCISNLKQVGVGFLLYANDQDGNYPMQVSTNAGGSMEYTRGFETFQHFKAAGSEITSTKVLVCPQDKEIKKVPIAQDFRTFRGSNLSYFITLNASQTNELMIMAGDRNLTWRKVPLRSGVFAFKANDELGWGEQIHTNSGNVMFANGGALKMKSRELAKYVQTLQTAHRVSIP